MMPNWCGGLLLASAVAASGVPPPDAALAAGRPLAPLEVRWKPARLVSPLPPWAPAPVELLEGSAAFPLPARWQQPSVDRFVLTVVFVDTEDSGPLVEWRSPGGVVTRLSDGLGESPRALGLHARTIVLPDAMTRDGGVVAVSMPWRLEGLVSVSVRPVRDVTVAVEGASSQPGLVARGGIAIEGEELEGREVPPVPGDVREGPVVEAELSAAIESLDGELEFRVPIQGAIEGAVLLCEALGLDPESRIEIRVNGRDAGELASVPFRLDDPALGAGEDGRLRLAGWRKHSLFVPARLWRQGENSISLRQRHPTGAAVRGVFPVSLKNTRLHLRFGTAPVAASPPREIWPVNLAESPEPDLTQELSIVQDLPPLPLVVTSPPPRPEPSPAGTPRVFTSPRR